MEKPLPANDAFLLLGENGDEFILGCVAQSDQIIIPFLVFKLVEGKSGILLDTHHHLCFFFIALRPKRLLLRVQASSVGKCGGFGLTFLYVAGFISKQAVPRHNEGIMNFCLAQMRGAARCIAVIFAVASPYGTAVFGITVPNL